jgi:hypothetical protein
VEQQKCLGIYLSDEKAIGIVLEGHSGRYKVLGCASVQRESDQDDISLAAMIIENISAQKLKYDEVSVAIDCSLYTQHDLHSEFSDYKQIANTIRFDAEEAVATDAMELAVTFDITNSDETGADVTVYTANRDMMTDMLNSMFQKGLDPTAMEPDIVCLTRFIEKNNTPLTDRSKLVVIVADTACYLIMPSDSHYAPCVRSFLMSPSQDITSVLAREVPITIASMTTAEPVTAIAVSGKTENINSEEFSLKTGLDVTTIDLAEKAGADYSNCPTDINRSDFAVAYGAALAELSRTSKTDFRKDFMPYEGRKRIIQNALRIFCIAATLIILAVGVHFQNILNKLTAQTEELKNSLYVEQATIIFGQPYTKKMKFSSKLAAELRKIKNGKSGPSFGDASSVTARMTFLFEAINATRKNNKFKINQVTINAKSMSVKGTTANKTYTNDFIKQIDLHKKLKKGTFYAPATSGESPFTINIKLK